MMSAMMMSCDERPTRGVHGLRGGLVAEVMMITIMMMMMDNDDDDASRIPEEPARGGQLRSHLSRLPGHLRQLLLKPRISAQASSLRMRGQNGE